MQKRTKLVLWIAVLASLVPFIDGSVVNVALPAIVRDFGGGFVTQQWVVDAYLVMLGAFMLVAGSLSDLFGRRKVILIGLISFGVTSLLCAAAPSGVFLIGARALQGVAGALLVPSALALIMSEVPASDRSKTIGTWAGLTGIAQIVGPFIGGVLVDAGSWRYVFLINVLPIVFTIWLLSRLEISFTRDTSVKLDTIGAVACAIGLAGLVYALIEQSHLGWHSPLIVSSLIIGVVALAMFIWREKVAERPMMPLWLFAERNFAVGNIATAAVYAGLSVATFAIVIFIQQVGGYTAAQAGLALIPVAVIMFLTSSKFGALAGKYGPRLFMALGPIVMAAGFLSMLRVGADASYLILLPGILLLGVGLSITVAPLTSAVLECTAKEHSGIASAINNNISRVAGLIATAAVGTIVGHSLGLAGFHRVVIAAAIVMVIGGLVSAIGIKNFPKHRATDN